MKTKNEKQNRLPYFHEQIIRIKRIKTIFDGVQTK